MQVIILSSPRRRTGCGANLSTLIVAFPQPFGFSFCTINPVGSILPLLLKVLELHLRMQRNGGIVNGRAVKKLIVPKYD
jgi:hypothetical protein